MKKFLILFPIVAFATIGKSQQPYATKNIETLGKIWGEVYLFHPSISRADRNIDWEKALVDFMPKLKGIKSNNDFILAVNNNLLSQLNDPFTLIREKVATANSFNQITPTNSFDYLRISERDYSDLNALMRIDSIVLDRDSNKPLVIDLRISEPISYDYHTNSFADYLVAMLIDKDIPGCQLVSREHYGWDEYNDWWFYEQSWKAKNLDKQQSYNGTIKPINAYAHELQQYIQDFDFDGFVPITRPVYIITNNSFLAHFNHLVISLKASRQETYIINENSGTIWVPKNSTLKKYSFQPFEFILNTSFHTVNGLVDMEFDQNVKSLDTKHINSVITNNESRETKQNSLTLGIKLSKYESENESLSTEEKFLGIIKIWTITKHFYPHKNRCSINWENSLGTYLELAQNTQSDKEYFTLIQEMMSTLNDSHVSTFHNSILDFSKLFVTPVQFEWIENKAIVTATGESVKSKLMVGDQITAIDDVPVEKILADASQKISSSNGQGLLATVINPGYFVGEANSKIKFLVQRNSKNISIELLRTDYIFQIFALGDNRPKSEVMNDVGYINMAAFHEASELESELVGMKDTKALIIDLRRSYPTSEYLGFLKMLCNIDTEVSQCVVPVISAKEKMLWIETEKISPSNTLNYNKPVVVLIDKTMISRPEHIAIALKAFPNVRFVGEQTQGTFGEVTKIHLPGGGETTFTGALVNNLKGETFQGIGIIPEVKVNRTVKGVKLGKDEILETAINLVSNL